MPCRDDGPHYPDPQVQERLDLVTRLLCEVVRAHPELLPTGSDELRRWWRRHETADRRRREQEERDRQRRREADQRRLGDIEEEAARLRERLANP